MMVTRGISTESGGSGDRRDAAAAGLRSPRPITARNASNLSYSSIFPATKVDLPVGARRTIVIEAAMSSA